MTMARKTTLLLIFGNLVLFLGGANWIIMAKEDHLATGRMVLLEVGRHDPRSLMQGDYMALLYPIAAEIDRHLAQDARGEGHVVIAIDSNDVGTFRRMFAGEELADGEHLLAYRIRWGRANRARVAAEEFLFQEGMAEEFQRTRYAELRVTEGGRTLLVALCDDERRRIGTSR